MTPVGYLGWMIFIISMIYAWRRTRQLDDIISQSLGYTPPTLREKLSIWLCSMGLWLIDIIKRAAPTTENTSRYYKQQEKK